MDDTATLRVADQGNLRVRATGADSIDLVGHLLATSSTAVGVTGGVGCVVHALKGELGGTKVGKELLEEWWASNGANVARLGGTACQDDSQGRAAGVVVDVGC